ncbi:MAG TPA: DUF4388 domain-containing protein [Myxococcota bacterium]|jgi:DNA-binding response OmpR family regulator|nr:DUF4388 domain-containing protein [Myxococcota bacterium]
MMRRASPGRTGVLIADGNTERAKRIAEACLARGADTRTANHGAAALEAALSEVPGVLVVPHELPIIPPAKLAEILRANPRTQAVRVLWIGEPPPDVPPSFADEIVPPPGNPDEVARCVEALLAQQARLEAVERGRGGEREVEGKLTQISLTDLLQLFHLNRRTGTIDLWRREAPGRDERAHIDVRDGNVVHAAVGNVEGEKALYRLLGWRTGTFAFSEGPVLGPARIRTPTRALLLEGMRQLDERERSAEALPPLDSQVTLCVKTAELPNIVHPLTQEVLLLLEIYSEVRDVVDHCSHPDYHVLRTLQTLAERGIVQVRKATSGAGGASEGLLNSIQARRLRDWIEGGRRRSRSAVDAKVVVLGSDGEATTSFLRALRTLPGVHLDPAFRPGPPSPTTLGPAARIVVEGGCGIELLHVPVGSGFGALWPALAHRALAVLFVVGPGADAPGRVRDAVASVRALAGSRPFFLRVLAPGEPPGTDALRSALSVVDDTTILPLPAEGDGDGRAALRALFARLVP